MEVLIMETALSIIFLTVNYRFSDLHLLICNHKNQNPPLSLKYIQMKQEFFLMPVNGGFIPVGNYHGSWC